MSEISKPIGSLYGYAIPLDPFVPLPAKTGSGESHMVTAKTKVSYKF